jgi:hypothetical protein
VRIGFKNGLSVITANGKNSEIGGLNDEKEGEWMMKVLVSRGYGAGLSTWNDDEHRLFFSMDPGLVELFEQQADIAEVRAYCEERTGAHTCLGGWSDVEVSELPDSTPFLITEYDGAERLITPEDFWYKGDGMMECPFCGHKMRPFRENWVQEWFKCDNCEWEEFRDRRTE